MHDILTGSQPDGTAIAGNPAKTTCGNWTLSGAGAAMVGELGVAADGRDGAGIEQRGEARASTCRAP
jgi:hypothetical protein